MMEDKQRVQQGAVANQQQNASQAALQSVRQYLKKVCSALLVENDEDNLLFACIDAPSGESFAAINSFLVDTNKTILYVQRIRTDEEEITSDDIAAKTKGTYF